MLFRSTTSVHPTVLAFGSLSLDSHTTPSRSSPRLPPETLDQILAELVPRTEPDLVQMTVHSVCLVAKDWLQSGRLALYRRPMLVLAEYSTQGDYGWSQPPPRSFRSAETGDALLRTLEDPESAFLGSLVENLLYLNTWVVDRHCACGEKMEKAYDWARRLLEACPFVLSASFPIRDMLIYDIEKPSPSLPVTFAQLMHLTMVILACDDYDKDSWALPTFHA